MFGKKLYFLIFFVQILFKKILKYIYIFVEKCITMAAKPPPILSFSLRAFYAGSGGKAAATMVVVDFSILFGFR